MRPIYEKTLAVLTPEELEKMDEGKKEDKEEEKHSLQESAEVLRMKKLAGLIK